MPKPFTKNPNLQQVVYKNQWRDTFDGTVPVDWQPTMKVSIVTAAFNSKTLPLTLASIAAQDYPEDLLEVVVVDDGSEPPVEIGKFTHKNTRLIRMNEAAGEGWGRSNALRRGIEASDGEIIYWVDSDMILFPDNVRTHAKWAHFIPEAATIGHKGFVEEWNFTPEEVYNAVRDGSIADYYDLSTLHRHWSLDIYDQTDELNATAGRNYSTHMGACATVTRTVYERTNGQDPNMWLGDDTEIAYQCWQAGAVFIPVNDALTYHLGRATVQDKADEVIHHNQAYFAQRMPIPRGRRTAKNRQWTVPYAVVVVEVDRDTMRYARECVDRVLNSSETDLHVLLVGPWSTLPAGRRRVLADPDNELHLVREWYRNEGRVTLVEQAPESVFPSPYRIDLPVTTAVSSPALEKMLQLVAGGNIGLTRFFAPEGAQVTDILTVTHTPALSRARAYVSDDVTLEEALDAVWSVEWHSADRSYMKDMRGRELTKKITRTTDAEEIIRLKRELRRAKAQLKELQQQRLRSQVRRTARKAAVHVRDLTR